MMDWFGLVRFGGRPIFFDGDRAGTGIALPVRP